MNTQELVQQQRNRLGAERAKLITDNMPVLVQKDDGSIEYTLTTSDPWPLGHGAFVVRLSGVGGGGAYDILRVHPLPRGVVPDPDYALNRR